VAAAKRNNGTHEGFSQSHKNVKALRQVAGLTNDKETAKHDEDSLYVGGMCHPMSMYWLAHRTGKFGKSFWDWLRPAGHFNDAAINVLVTKTIMYKAKGAGAVKRGIIKQDDFDDVFFLRYGLVRNGEKLAGYSGFSKVFLNTKTAYYMLSHHGPNSGHACALHTTSSATTYFDPNYGDFSFTNVLDAFTWYQEYLTITKYDSKYTDNGGIGYKPK
jgi:hypothetical protein